MNKRHYEHTLPNIRGSLSNTYSECCISSLETEKSLFSVSLFNTSVPIFLALSSFGKAVTVSIEGMVGW